MTLQEIYAYLDQLNCDWSARVVDERNFWQRLFNISRNREEFPEWEIVLHRRILWQFGSTKISVQRVICPPQASREDALRYAVDLIKERQSMVESKSAVGWFWNTIFPYQWIKQEQNK